MGYVLSQYQWVAYGFDHDDSEFQPYHDDCGPDANEKCRAAVRRTPFSAANMDAIRSRDIANKLWFFDPNGVSRGQNIYHLFADTQRFDTVPTRIWPTQVSFDNPDYGYLEAKLDEIIFQNHNVCVANVGNAQALPGNEAGVQWHFVAIGGGDNTPGQPKRYLLANGDDVVRNGPSRWITFSDLQAAHLVGLVEYVLPHGGASMFPGWTPQGDGYLGPPSPEAGNPRYLVRGGILDVLQKNPAMVAALGNIPVSDIYLGSDGMYHQYFLCGEVYWKSATEFGFDWAGLALKQANATIQALNDQLAKATAQVSTLSELTQSQIATIKSLNEQIQALENQGNDPKVIAAEQLAAAVKILASE